MKKNRNDHCVNDAFSRKRADKLDPSSQLVLDSILQQDLELKLQYKNDLQEQLQILQKNSSEKVKKLRKAARTKKK